MIEDEDFYLENDDYFNINVDYYDACNNKEVHLSDNNYENMKNVIEKNKNNREELKNIYLKSQERLRFVLDWIIYAIENEEAIDNYLGNYYIDLIKEIISCQKTIEKLII